MINRILCWLAFHQLQHVWDSEIRDGVCYEWPVSSYCVRPDCNYVYLFDKPEVYDAEAKT